MGVKKPQPMPAMQYVGSEGGAECIRILGSRCRDRVTTFVGMASSVCFDAYGCIQVCLTPTLDADGKPQDARWFDIGRLEELGEPKVIDTPDFTQSLTPVAVQQGQKGPEPSRPARC